MRINSLILQPNPNSPISIGLKFKNIEILGLMNTQNVRVEGFTSDVKDPILLEGTLPQAIIRGPYEGSGTVLGLPFKGKGDCEIVLTNLKLTGHLHGKLINGYLSIDDVSLTMSLPDKVHFKFGGLFDGNKDLGDTANAFVNDNWREIFESMKDDMALAFAKIVKEITKTALGSVQYKELFKEQ
ncbi:unnamed protein product [Ceratitis capitata]|uniref:(Mediterranean fruit fly) hypothetical protein n=2 Tax=Ceratitis capitata TaxID=7213 RepID=A0A811U2P6_CERCA|nr:unnamed protein product [Ceratitis capitata]